LDVDFYLPQPGIIRTQVAPVKSASPTEVLELQVKPVEPVGRNGQAEPRRLTDAVEGFRRVEGFNREYLAQRYGEYDVNLMAADHQTVLTSTRVVVSAEHPLVEITLPLSAK
jgi:hypothetical protein